jgi:hypothetical protein
MIAGAKPTSKWQQGDHTAADRRENHARIKVGGFQPTAPPVAARVAFPRFFFEKPEKLHATQAIHQVWIARCPNRGRQTTSAIGKRLVHTA